MSINSSLSDISSAYGIFSGAESGTQMGELEAALASASLASKTGAFGSSSSAIGTAASEGQDVIGLATGIEQGGVEGDVEAGVSGLRLTSTLGSSTGALSTGPESVAGGLSAAAGVAGAGLALYNEIESYTSGATGADTLSGAETGLAVGGAVTAVGAEVGAEVGTDVFPGFGTVIGGVIGAAVGAVASAFGPGEKDPEQYTWDAYDAAYQSNPSSVSDITPAQAFQSLTGIFDARSSDNPIYAQYGRAGEGAFLNAMAAQINSAYNAGTINSSTSASQIFSTVVQPWIASMPGGSNYFQSGGYQGDSAQPFSQLLTTLIGQYTSGALTNQTQIGVNGQTASKLPAFAGISQVQAEQEAAYQAYMAPLIAQGNSMGLAFVQQELAASGASATTIQETLSATQAALAANTTQFQDAVSMYPSATAAASAIQSKLTAAGAIFH